MLAPRFKRLCFFPLTRLGFLWYGVVAVNPINAGGNMMTSEPRHISISFPPLMFF